MGGGGDVCLAGSDIHHRRVEEDRYGTEPEPVEQPPSPALLQARSAAFSRRLAHARAAGGMVVIASKSGGWWSR